MGAGPPLPLPDAEEEYAVYCASVHPGRLWQGEILTNVPQWKLTPEGIVASAAQAGPPPEAPGPMAVELLPIDHPLVIVLSQDCDLVQDFKARANGSESLWNLFICDI